LFFTVFASETIVARTISVELLSKILENERSETLSAQVPSKTRMALISRNYECTQKSYATTLEAPRSKTR